jgi:hypothetical protein
MFQSCESRFASVFEHASKLATAVALGSGGYYNPLRRGFMRSANHCKHRERGVCQLAT